MVRTPAEAAAAAMRVTVLEERADEDGPEIVDIEAGPPEEPTVTPEDQRCVDSEIGDFIEASGLLRYDPGAITRIYAGLSLIHI